MLEKTETRVLWLGALPVQRFPVKMALQKHKNTPKLNYKIILYFLLTLETLLDPQFAPVLQTLCDQASFKTTNLY